MLGYRLPCSKDLFGIADDIVVDQLGAILAKPDPVFGTAAQLWSKTGVEPGTASGCTGNMGGNS